MLSWLLYLAIEPEGTYSRAALVSLERIAQGVPVVKKSDQLAPVAPNVAFEKLDQLSQQSGTQHGLCFESEMQGHHCQALVEKFPDEADPASDFWVRTYGLVVKAPRQDDNLTTFTYLILSSTEDKSAQQWVKSTKSRLEKLGQALDTLLLALLAQWQAHGGGELPA
ncbi:MAG: hypothetical protein EOO62_40035 [Hymenobacter sp.]|nr:MAG: hypothetical protein EOO62_40035 [Hymenobacter sp.]